MLHTENRLLQLFHELHDRYPDRIAGPFLSVPPADYDPVAVPSILYVGKATGGPWGLSDFLSSPTVTERHEFHPERKRQNLLEIWLKEASRLVV
jgi:hypothetical protein